MSLLYIAVLCRWRACKGLIPCPRKRPYQMSKDSLFLDWNRPQSLSYKRQKIRKEVKLAGSSYVSVLACVPVILNTFTGFYVSWGNVLHLIII
jgi:preprotein translocase subunit SecY